VAEKDDYLVDILTDLGFVTAEQVARAREEATAAGVGVVDFLVANKMIRSADVTQAKAAHFGVEMIPLGDLQLTDDVISLIRRDVAKKYRVVPVSKFGNTVTIALADPSDLDAIDSLHHILRAEIEYKVASEEEIEYALNKYYGGRATMGENSQLEKTIQELTQAEVGLAIGGGGDDETVVEADAHQVGQYSECRSFQNAGFRYSSRAAFKNIPCPLSH
jgi:MshEN domain